MTSEERATPLWWHQAVDEAARVKSSVERAAELFNEIPAWLALAAQHAENVRILVESHQPVKGGDDA